MARYCLLNRLSIEVFHSLFTYFLAHEIIFSFSDISDHINEILLTYTAYQLNLKSISRIDFDFLCHRIKPEQVIALTLSDNNDTPGQTELFLFYFQIEQFINLKSLTLINIEFESLETILFHLKQLKQLRTLSFNESTITFKYPVWVHDYSNDSNRMKSLLLNTYSSIFPRLSRLSFGPSTNLRSIQFLNLRYLKLEQCSIDDLKIIMYNTSKLQSLDICLYVEESDLTMILPSSQLIYMKLKIHGYSISMYQMDQILSNLSYLKHFDLILPNCHQDFLDGQRWEILTKSLQTFKFKLNFPFSIKSNDVHLFQTSYWLSEKCWLVDSYDHSIFTIPDYTPNHVIINKWTEECLIKSVEIISINSIPRNQLSRYTFIKKLILNCSISREQILSIIDLKHLEGLSILFINDLLIFLPFEYTVPKVTELKIENTIAYHMIEQLKGYRLKQIRKLTISISEKNTNIIHAELLYIFPCIEYLRYLSNQCSIDRMIDLIDRFQCLLNVSFYSTSFQSEMKLNIYPDRKLISQHSYRLTANNFTSRFEYLSNDRPLYARHWWIASSQLQAPSVDHWPSGYKLKYLLFQGADTRYDQLLLHCSVCCIMSQLIGPTYRPLLHILESIIGYTFLPTYIYYLFLTIIIYSLILMILAYFSFTASSGSRKCILFIIFQYCMLNQWYRYYMNCDFHSAIVTIFINIYNMRYIVYLGFKRLFDELIHLIT